MATGVGLGTVIGLERQYRARMAGLRTNALVAAEATLFVLLDVVARQTSELVSQTERDALAAALRERLAGDRHEQRAALSMYAEHRFAGALDDRWDWSTWNLHVSGVDQAARPCHVVMPLRSARRPRRGFR